MFMVKMNNSGDKKKLGGKKRMIDKKKRNDRISGMVEKKRNDRKKKKRNDQKKNGMIEKKSGMIETGYIRFPVAIFMRLYHIGISVATPPRASRTYNRSEDRVELPKIRNRVSVPCPLIKC